MTTDQIEALTPSHDVNIGRQQGLVGAGATMGRGWADEQREQHQQDLRMACLSRAVDLQNGNLTSAKNVIDNAAAFADFVLNGAKP